MMGLHLKNVFDSEDDDYELPNLSERIQSFSLTKNVECKKKSSDCESSEEEFLKFSEKIQSTPHSQAIFHNKKTIKEESSSPALLEASERNSKTSLMKLNLQLNGLSESDSDDDEFLKFSEKIQNTPRSQVICLKKETTERKSSVSAVLKSVARTKGAGLTELNLHQKEASDSESDENDFLNFSERIRNTPRSQVKLPADQKIGKENRQPGLIKSTDKVFKTPLPKNKHLFINKVSSSTPLSALNISSDSEDDYVFLKVRDISKRHTPKAQNRVHIGKESPLLSSNISEKNPPLLTPSILKGISKSESSVGDGAKAAAFTPVQLANIEEYKSLFSFESDSDNSFMRQRTRYAKQLFEFFNKKIFNSELPEDTPLTWSETLQLTAGQAICSLKAENYICSIELSSKLLTSFDRLRDTLLHEMCHAAVWVISKQKNVNHGPLWEIWASRCNLILPTIECPKRCHNYEGNYRFWYYCPKCNWKKGRCRQSEKLLNSVCKKCRTPVQITITN